MHKSSNSKKQNQNQTNNPIQQMRTLLYELLKSNTSPDKIYIVIDELIRKMQKNPAEFVTIFDSYRVFYENVHDILSQIS